MKKSVFALIVILTTFSVSCNTQTEKKQQVIAVSGNDVEIYYFHMTTRCVTCNTIEAETRRNVEMLYPEQFKSGKISFTSLNIEEPAGKATGEHLGVNSQTLLIVKGDQKINITNEGFLYAVAKPEKFTEIIKEKVDPLLK
jgi:hypothetical protein